jgi:hypothetical protein
MKSMFDIGLSDVKAVLDKKGYLTFTKEGVPNIVGIRNASFDKDDSYNDICWVFWNEKGKEQVHNYSITTHPGYHYLQNPIQGSKGTAILVPGQYLNCWILGMHLNKQFALCQRGGPVKVYRDNNKDTILDCDPNTIDMGFFGIDGHHGALANTNVIGPYSAGCQVWRYNEPHEELMMKFKELSEANKFKTFSYTLLEQKDFN